MYTFLKIGSRLRDKGVALVEVVGSPGLPADMPVREHVTAPKINQISAKFYSKFDAGKTDQQSVPNEEKDTICISRNQANCGPDLETLTESLPGTVEDDGSGNVASDDHILGGYVTEEKEAEKKREILNKCLASATIDSYESYLNDTQKPHYYIDETYDLKQCSPASSYHSTSSGDAPLTDYSFLTISDINLRTQPLEVSPPSRAPPKLDLKQGVSKFRPPQPSDIAFNQNYHAYHVGGPGTRHLLKESVNSALPSYSNVEMNGSKAAATSAAAVIEAMEQAQASLKSAKELMERKRVPQTERKLGSYDLGFWNEQNINFSEHSKHKTKKVQKSVHNQVDRVVPSLLCEDVEVVQGEESGSYKLSDQKRRCHEWKIDKQFYELVSSEKLMRSSVMNDEQYRSNEDIKLVHQIDVHQYFPKKETCGLQGRRFLQGGGNSEDENKLEMLNTFRINEKKTFSGSELQMQDGNAKWLKSGILTDKEEAINILETSSAIDDEDKEKLVGVVLVPNDDIKKAVDPINLIQQDRYENKLKQCQEFGICTAENKNADSDSESITYEKSSLGSIGFCMDGKSEEFDGSEALKEMLDKVKEEHLHTSSMNEISEASVVFEYDECRSDEVKVDTKNMEAAREESQFGMFKQMKKENHASYNDGKDSEVQGIDNTYKPENMSFNCNDKTIKPVKKKRAKWNIPKRCDLNVVKLFVQPVCSEKTDEALEFHKSEEKNVFEMPQKFKNYEGRLTDDEVRLNVNGEKGKDENNFLREVQAALELEARQVSQRIRVQNSKAVQQANQWGNKVDIPRPFVDASGSSWKQMENSTLDGGIDAKNISKDALDRERKHPAVLKRKLAEKERVREQEKDMSAVENSNHKACEMVFAEARESSEDILFGMDAAKSQQRPITIYRDVIESSVEAIEMSERIANDAKLKAECASVERAPVEAKECALSKQVSLGARRQAEASGNIPKDKNWKHNEVEDIVRHGNKDNEYNAKTISNVNDAPVDMKIHSEGYEEESPLRCKARQERCRRIVERAAKALAEKNMRDLFAQRELAERNRLAESLDAEVRRWSSGKEGNLRALLSTLQYILGHDSGWQPIPLTEVITVAAVRKAYRKATLYVHPDKLQQRSATIQHKYICEKVFDLLKDAWSKFNSEG